MWPSPVTWWQIRRQRSWTRIRSRYHLQGLLPEAHLCYLDHSPYSSMTTRDSTIPGGSLPFLWKLRGHRNSSVSCSYTLMLVGIIITCRMWKSVVQNLRKNRQEVGMTMPMCWYCLCDVGVTMPMWIWGDHVKLGWSGLCDARVTVPVQRRQGCSPGSPYRWSSSHLPAVGLLGKWSSLLGEETLLFSFELFNQNRSQPTQITLNLFCF